MHPNDFASVPGSEQRLHLNEEHSRVQSLPQKVVLGWHFWVVFAFINFSKRLRLIDRSKDYEI